MPPKRNLDIHTAAGNGDVERLKQLLSSSSSSVDVNSLDAKNSYAPLHHAALAGQTAAVRVLLGAAGVDVDAVAGGTAYKGLTPLAMAVLQGHTGCVEALLAQGGADPNKLLCGGGTTALHLAFGEKASKEILQLLLAHGGQVNLRNGMAASVLAISTGYDQNVGCVEVLLKAGADVSLVDVEGNTALMLAAERGSLNILKLLINAKGRLTPLERVNVDSKNGQTPIMFCAKKGHRECVIEILRAGGLVNAQDDHPERGYSALHLAVNFGHENVIPVLLAAGANVGARSSKGETPLEWARGDRKFAIVKMLESTPKAATAEQQRQRGNAAFGAGDFAGAIAEYQKALAQLDNTTGNDTAEAKKQKIACHSNSALCFLELGGQFAEAHAAASKALELNNNHFKAIFRRGLAAKGLEEFAAAESDFRRCLEIDPNDLDVQEELKAVLAKKEEAK